MKVSYTKHALERMSERGVSQRDVKEAIRRGKKKFGKIGAVEIVYKGLKVITNLKPSDNYKIITAYYEN